MTALKYFEPCRCTIMPIMNYIILWTC